MPDALIVFAKAPEPGFVKTRLSSVLTPREAASLYDAFLCDALAQYAKLPADVRLYLDANGDPTLDSARQADAVSQQQGNDLGERMARAFAETFAAGYERAVIIGTDHPTLPDAFVELAFAALDRPRSVSIGPALDGGYYLLGMNDLLPALFSGMRYSHSSVFEKTLQRARAERARLTILPEWYDVDTPADLHRLAGDLSEESTVDPVHSRRVMNELMRAHADFFSSVPGGVGSSSSERSAAP